MLRPAIGPIVLPLLLACAQAQVHESNKKWANGIIVASNLCAGDRSAQHTTDPAGQRVYCAFEELIGSHIPKCVCRDEMRFREERAEAQEWMREASNARQPGSSVDASMNHLPAHSGSGH
jgi:hypothetical protein